MIIAITMLFILFCCGSTWLLWSRYNEKLHETLQLLSKTQEQERKLQKDIESLKVKIHHTTEDAVTQLPSWQLFEDRLQQSVKESARYQLVLGLLVIDLEGIPLPAEGLLSEAAQRLKRSIRQVDSISRLNKETFVVMVTRLSKPETAAIVAQRILQSLVQPFNVDDEVIRISASIGIATLPQDGQDGAELLLAAEHALHVAKAKGAHRYEFFQPAMISNSRRKLLVSSGLNADSIFDEFAVRYQPIMNIENEEIICMDAMLSWEHSELGLIETDELLEHAEKQQKTSRVIEWLLQKSCEQFMHWRSLGFRPPLLGVTIPISLLQSSAFVCKLPQLLKKIQFDPAWLLIQIKPGSKQHSLDVLEKSFNMLSYLRIQVALDDFGANGLSMLQLKHFPVNYFKLDKTLIKDMITNPHAAGIIHTSLNLAKNLNAQLIIQGVETQEQRQFLKENGCLLIEGQAVGAPLTENEIEIKVIP